MGLRWLELVGAAIGRPVVIDGDRYNGRRKGGRKGKEAVDEKRLTVVVVAVGGAALVVEVF